MTINTALYRGKPHSRHGVIPDPLLLRHPSSTTCFGCQMDFRNALNLVWTISVILAWIQRLRTLDLRNVYWTWERQHSFSTGPGVLCDIGPLFSVYVYSKAFTGKAGKGVCAMPTDPVRPCLRAWRDVPWKLQLAMHAATKPFKGRELKFFNKVQLPHSKSNLTLRKTTVQRMIAISHLPNYVVSLLTQGKSWSMLDWLLQIGTAWLVLR
ncbi:uncharacterized protein EV420DRAFT_1748697 [Desarmillaria tabescens]|uniref:Uncharacterized protein n=1 Tax=Armillaria tabescens TaxID=1929756 RepID=A0AA39N4F8_ARMTA|nr:uncharacterized protein EV420DRAFT_1748697 [Desarmillaria tabescens]KAK0457562.1 hypothetical protein EV420DRAFT_1748697 [Desarmillaria tabescens]